MFFDIHSKLPREGPGNRDSTARALRLMGAELGDTLPLSIHGQSLHGIEYTMPVASAQVKAAILLAALQADGSTTIHEPGPSRDHSERLLRSLGVSVVNEDNTVVLTPSGKPLSAFEVIVPGDISSAAFVIAAAALVPNSEVTVMNVGLNETRTGILNALVAMGSASPPMIRNTLSPATGGRARPRPRTARRQGW